MVTKQESVMLAEAHQQETPSSEDVRWAEAVRERGCLRDHKTYFWLLAIQLATHLDHSNFC